MPQYMLILHDVSADDANSGVPAGASAQAHTDWIEDLKQRGLYVTGFKLSGKGGQYVTTERGRPAASDGASARDAVAGILVVDVEDKAAAEWIARESPHLRGSNFVEIRAVDREAGDAPSRAERQADISSPVTSGTARPQSRGFRIRTAVLVLILALAAGLTGLFATDAFSRGFGFGPWHGHGGFMGPLDPALIEDRADRMVRHLAIEIDASAEQQDKLRAIVKAAVRDLVPLRQRTHAARQQARDLLTQSTIDRAEIEKFRAEHIALADAASRRLAQAIADAAEILTPEQRRKINDHFPPGGGYWHRWRRG